MCSLQAQAKTDGIIRESSSRTTEHIKQECSQAE